MRQRQDECVPMHTARRSLTLSALDGLLCVVLASIVDDITLSRLYVENY
jgi:hypothetical protein